MNDDNAGRVLACLREQGLLDIEPTGNEQGCDGSAWLLGEEVSWPDEVGP